MESQKKKILLIEDDRAYREMLCEKLSDKGYYVVVSGETRGAVTWATAPATRKVDMIISDQRMPGEEGSSFLGFLNLLKKTDPEKIDRKSEVYQKVRGRFPDLSDAEFLDVVKNIKTRWPIMVILSGYAEDEDIKRAKAEGSVDLFLSKEDDINDTLRTIDRLLKSV